MRLVADVIHESIRGLRHSRSATTLSVAVLTIALAAGTVTFSIVDAVALRPLPFADPGRLVAVGLLNDAGTAVGNASAQDYAAWSNRVPAFEAMGAYRRSLVASLDVGGAGRQVAVARVTPGFLELLGARAELGRLFGPDHDSAGADEVLVLSHALWTAAFGADPSVVGTTVALGAEPRTIIGVLQPGLAYPVDQATPTDAYVPVVLTPDEKVEPASSMSFDIQVVGRLRAGATIAQAQEQIDAINLGRPGRQADRRTHLVQPLLHQLVGTARMWLLLVLAAVGCVLLVACLNVANLLLARATVRARELATREVLGASRARIVATLLGEGLMIATVAGVVGAGLAALVLDAVTSVLPSGLVRASTIGLDLRVLVVSTVVVFACGLACASAPAWLASGTDLLTATRSQTNGALGRGRGRAAGAFLVAEVAFVTTLLVVATTIVASFVLFTTADLGYDRRDLAVYGVQKSFDATPREARAAAGATFRGELVRAVAAIPGVTGVALIRTGVPMSGRSTSYPASIVGPQPTSVSAPARVVSPEYFDTMRLRLVRGRTFDAADGLGAPGVAVVSDAFEARYFERGDAVGQTIRLRGLRTIVGVVRGVHQFGPDRVPEPEVYVPIDQDSTNAEEVVDLVVRSSPGPAALVPIVRATAQSLVGDGTVFQPRFIDAQFRRLSADRRFNAGLMTAFAAISLLIGVVGIYGTMAFEVAQNVRAIGIRLALGATPARLRRGVLARAARLAAIGAAIGLAGAWALSATLASLVFGVTSTSPVVYAGIVLLLFAASVLGAFVPALRASRLEPLVTLRAE